MGLAAEMLADLSHLGNDVDAKLASLSADTAFGATVGWALETAILPLHLIGRSVLSRPVQSYHWADVDAARAGQAVVTVDTFAGPAFLKTPQ